MAIEFFAEQVTLPAFDKSAVRNWIEQVLANNKLEAGTLTFIFCTDEYLLEMNKRYLNHDYFTDVITFDYSLNKRISGDIFISTDRVRQNAITFGKSELNELLRVVIHGVLHLCGQSDKTEAERAEMTRAENLALGLYKGEPLN